MPHTFYVRPHSRMITLGLIASVLIVALWILSIFRIVRYGSDGDMFLALRSGRFWIASINLQHMHLRPLEHFDNPDLDRFGLTLPSRWFVTECGETSHNGYILPLWMPLAACAVPTLILAHRSRRPPPGHCRACGYNLFGNTSGACPECGKPTQPDNQRSSA